LELVYKGSNPLFLKIKLTKIYYIFNILYINYLKLRIFFFFKFKSIKYIKLLTKLKLLGLISYFYIMPAYIKVYLNFFKLKPVLISLKFISKLTLKIFINYKFIIKLIYLTPTTLYFLNSIIGIKTHLLLLKYKIGGLLVLMLN
jgi:hypothetical protein